MGGYGYIIYICALESLGVCLFLWCYCRWCLLLARFVLLIYQLVISVSDVGGRSSKLKMNLIPLILLPFVVCLFRLLLLLLLFILLPLPRSVVFSYSVENSGGWPRGFLLLPWLEGDNRIMGHLGYTIPSLKENFSFYYIYFIFSLSRNSWSLL